MRSYVSRTTRSISKWKYRLRRQFKNVLDTKKSFSSLYNNTVKFEKTDKLTTKVGLYAFHVIKPLYRIDILLWYLNYFVSSSDARQNIHNRKVFVNGKIAKVNYFLKKGDVISLSKSPAFEKKRSYSRVRRKYKTNKLIFSFIEHDCYSNTILIIKDLFDLSSDDFRLLVEKHIKVQDLMYQ